MGHTIVSSGVVCSFLLAFSAGVRGAEPSAFHRTWTNAPVPGGAAGLLAAAGIDGPIDRHRLIVELTRLVHEAGDDDRRDRQRRLVRYLDNLEDDEASSDVVPLPLGEALWRRLLGGRSNSPVLPRILRNREASLLYSGLLPLDDSTLGFLESDRETLTQLYRKSSAAFAAFGQSLRVRDGRVVVPGGENAETHWQALAGEPPTRPGAFIGNLFARDRGRLAYFYDAVAALPEVRQRRLFVAASGTTRVSRLEALYRVFADFDSSWKPHERPFSRRAFDPAWVLGKLDLHLEAGSDAADPAQRWREVVQRLPDGGRVDLGTPWSEESLAWILSWLTPVDLSRRIERMHALLLGRRLFGLEPPAGAAAAVLADFSRFPTLFLALERLGVQEADVYLAAGGCASRLSGLAANGSLAPIAMFQAGLTVLERTRFAGALSVREVTRLARSWIELPWNGDGGDGTAVVRWLTGTFLPAVVGGNALQPEAALMRGLAGAGTDGADSQDLQIMWEASAYRLDVGGAELDRLGRLRQMQRTVSLDLVLALVKFADALTRMHGSIEPDRDTAESMRRLAVALRDADGLGEVLTSGRGHASDVLEGVAGALEADQLVPERAAQAMATRLSELVEPLVAASLVSLAYLPHLGTPRDLSTAAATVAARHDFGFAPGRPRDAPGAWHLAREVRGTGAAWHLEGSLLGLDVALARLTLWRIDSTLPPPPALNENHRAAFVETVALTSPSALTDEARDVIAGALARGRARIERLTPDSVAGFAAAGEEAGLGPLRRRLLPWVLANEPAAMPTFFSLSEVYWLGAGEDDRRRLDPWGTSARSTDGCLCLRFPGPAQWERSAGRPETGQLATTLVDLKLRILESLARLDMPAALAAATLGAATQDFVDRARPVHDDDRLALVRYAQELPDARIEDYVAALTAGGPLVPEMPVSGQERP